jgi:hypothetical protein
LTAPDADGKFNVIFWARIQSFGARIDAEALSEIEEHIAYSRVGAICKDPLYFEHEDGVSALQLAHIESVQRVSDLGQWSVLQSDYLGRKL